MQPDMKSPKATTINPCQSFAGVGDAGQIT
jgi:hypothetical protein